MSTLKDFPVAEYRQTYGLQVMVETGTYLGASVLTALEAGFETIASCELAPMFTARARQTLLTKGPRDWENRVTLFTARSVDWLPEILPKIEDLGRALFFFDAHVDPALFDGKITPSPAPEEQLLPLPKELEILLGARDVAHDVIIIDDLHLYVQKRWIGIEWAAKWGLPTTQPPYQTEMDLVKLFPGHESLIVDGLSALILRPLGDVD